LGFGEIDEVLAEQESEFDADSRWAVAWFDQYGFAEGPYGAAETLSTAKNTSVLGMVEAGILSAKAGKVRLLRTVELPDHWDPIADLRLTVWEGVHHLIRTLEAAGETGTAELLRQLPKPVVEAARDLAYRLYTICERRKWAREALVYNMLVVSWPKIERLAQSAGGPTKQDELL
jgi:putative DNA methylase